MAKKEKVLLYMSLLREEKKRSRSMNTATIDPLQESRKQLRMPYAVVSYGKNKKEQKGERFYSYNPLHNAVKKEKRKKGKQLR